MKVVVLTNKNSKFGQFLINALVDKGVTIDAVVVVQQPLSYYFKLLKFVAKRVGWLNAFIIVVQKFFRKVHLNIPADFNYDNFSECVQMTGGTNSEATIRMLRELKPEIIFLGQTGIIRSRVIEIPSIGVLNLHPGVLPKYRGVDSTKWALFQNEFSSLGSTLHWVDKGVDTGDIIEVYSYKMSHGKTLEQIEAEITEQGIKKAAKCIKENRLTNKMSQGLSDGEQYYKMSPQKEKEVRRKLREWLF